jgi:SAM-dependent methyltransferase
VDDFARLYDLDTVDLVDDLDFYTALARRTGGPVLEIGCGTGRVLVPLADAGFQVTGVDNDPRMLARARDRVERSGVGERVKLVEADARTLNLYEHFALAVVALNSFLHFTADDDQIECLRGIRRHLRRGGLLVLDLPNPEPALLGEVGGQVVLEWIRRDPETGAEVTKLRSQRVDTSRQLVELTLLFDEASKQEGGQETLLRRTYTLPLRYVYRRELELLLEKCGFAVESVYGGYDLSEYSSDSLKLIALARAEG